MITIYGIHNCDTVQKAIKWLDKNKIPYTFHNYKESGIDKPTLELWLKQLPVDKLINLRSTTFRELSDDEKAGIANKSSAIALMIKYNSIIKRPVWDFGNGNLYLGWNEADISKLV